MSVEVAGLGLVEAEEAREVSQATRLLRQPLQTFPWRHNRDAHDEKTSKNTNHQPILT